PGKCTPSPGSPKGIDAVVPSGHEGNRLLQGKRMPVRKRSGLPCPGGDPPQRGTGKTFPEILLLKLQYQGGAGLCGRGPQGIHWGLINPCSFFFAPCRRETFWRRSASSDR